MAPRPFSRSTPRSKAAPSAKPDSGAGRGMEFAIVVLAFLGVGYLLDGLFDTKPVFMIILVVLSLVGQFASMWYGYDARMHQLEAERQASSTSAGRAGSRTAAEVAATKPGRIYEPAVSPGSITSSTDSNES